VHTVRGGYSYRKENYRALFTVAVENFANRLYFEDFQTAPAPGRAVVFGTTVEALGIPLLTDPTPWMQHRGVLAAVVGVTLLIADVLLPVPSSLVMVAHGALFGVVLGTLLSLLGSIGAALFGFAIGRRGGKLLERVVTPAERVRADKMLARWGTLAVIVTRPVPLSPRQLQSWPALLS
jgi:uncharacterized membrane protein YdjX (TVP38/TMEM64 family)